MATDKSSNQARFCFVVLHYKTIDETLASVESIERTITYENCAVVVVDNGSGNGTGATLDERYKDDPRVTVLLLPENLGFARGNNKGFEYAKNELGCEYICLINSDAVVTQPDLCERVIEIMQRTGCAVLGPKIVNRDQSVLGPHTAPGPDFLATDMRDLQSFVDNGKRGHDISRRLTITRMIRALRPSYREQSPRLLDPQQCHDNAVLEGCCLFFAPSYVALFDGLDDRTFLYHEEDLLYLRLQKNGMKTYYDPSISINHNSHATTRSLNQSDFEHRLFRSEHQIESRKVLLKELGVEPYASLADDGDEA